MKFYPIIMFPNEHTKSLEIVEFDTANEAYEYIKDRDDVMDITIAMRNEANQIPERGSYIQELDDFISELDKLPLVTSAKWQVGDSCGFGYWKTGLTDGIMDPVGKPFKVTKAVVTHICITRRRSKADMPNHGNLGGKEDAICYRIEEIDESQQPRLAAWIWEEDMITYKQAKRS